MPFASNTKRKMVKCLTDRIDSKVKANLSGIKDDAKQAVYQLDVVDSTATAEATTATYTKQGDNRTLKLFTPTTVTDRYGTYYPVFPFFGWGSSRKYGARNWLRLGAAKALRRLKFDARNLPNPNERFRK